MIPISGLRCDNCSATYIPPRIQCHACGQAESHDILLSGRGTVQARTTIHIAPTRYEQDTPYTVLLVHLDDGPRLMGRLDVGEIVEPGTTVVHIQTDAERGPIFRRA